MAGRHEIETYSLTRYSGTMTTNEGGFVYKHQGYILCSSTKTKDRLRLAINPDDVPLQVNKTVTTGPVGATADFGFMFIRRDEVPMYLDLLRNEKPVYMDVRTSTYAGFNSVSTSDEPVGEGTEVA